MIDALRYEFVRMRTIRSTYWLIGAALGFQLGMSLLIAWRISDSDSFRGDEAFDILATIGASTGIAPLFIAYIIGLLGVFSMGHEYRHGMIRATLTAIPNRHRVFLAKIVSTATVTAAAALACVVVALIGIAIFGLDFPSWRSFAEMTIGTVLFTVLFGLSGFAYAALVRHQTAAVAMLVLVPSVVERIIQAVVLAIKAASDDPRGHGGLVGILKYLPFDAGGQMYTRASINDLLEFLGYVPFGPVGGGIVLTVFVGALLGVAWWLFVTRDA